MSRIDYGNSLLCGLPSSSLLPLQGVQNMAARVISRRRKYDHISPVPQELHWLPIQSRTEYKVICLVHRALYQDASLSVGHVEIGGRQNTVMCHRSLVVPRTNNRYGDRSFSHKGPLLWNSLPVGIRNIEDVTCFRKA
ncbi:uncharacterized protein LOC141902152 [Tubulanus polymorphus]|uniref:uncharacterized protein LOC141902152 n=1 Tax=Tubulanus polymorphus TaxID=672921 RepID=UPI003DA2222E